MVPDERLQTAANSCKEDHFREFLSENIVKSETCRKAELRLLIGKHWNRMGWMKPSRTFEFLTLVRVFASKK